VAELSAPANNEECCTGASPWAAPAFQDDSLEETYLCVLIVRSGPPLALRPVMF
jgi:hypothetical protein